MDLLGGGGSGSGFGAGVARLSVVGIVVADRSRIHVQCTYALMLYCT